MKLLNKTVFVFIIACNLTLRASAQPIIINYNTSGLADFDIKRGYILSDAIKTNYTSLLQYADKSKALGMKLMLVAKDMNQFDPKWADNPKKTYYLSYRSQNSTIFTANDTEEFSKDSNGKIHISINKQFLNLCRKIRDNELQIVLQCSGVPVEGLDNGDVKQLFSLDPLRTFHESARYYPFPAVQAYDSVATVIVDYVKSLRDSLKINNMICFGNQEPSHTAGYFAGKQTAQGTIDNIKQYVKTWKPIAELLTANNIANGALQLNSSKIDYITGVNALRNENAAIDYFSLQNYKSENNISVLTEAINQLRTNNLLTSKKILMNRYSFESSFATQNSEQFNTSRGICEFLDTELNLCKFAEYIYGYCYFAGAQNQLMMDSVFVFLNKAPSKQKDMSGLPKDVYGLALADDKRLSLAIWNKGSVNQTLSVDLSTFPETFKRGELKIYKGANTLFSAFDNANVTNSGITNLQLNENEFMLISLTAGMPNAISINTDNNQLYLYPNPCKDNVYIKNLFGRTCTYELYDDSGKLLQTARQTNQIDVKHLCTGTYFVKLYTGDNGWQLYPLIKSN